MVFQARSEFDVVVLVPFNSLERADGKRFNELSGLCMKEVPGGEPQTTCGEGRIERDNESVHGEALCDTR